LSEVSEERLEDAESEDMAEFVARRLLMKDEDSGSILKVVTVLVGPAHLLPLYKLRAQTRVHRLCGCQASTSIQICLSQRVLIMHVPKFILYVVVWVQTWACQHGHMVEYISVGVQMDM
jgi:hypothetical protein